MKAKFSKQYILENKGCYNADQVNDLPFDNNNEITLETLFETIPIKDFCWFLAKKCDLTKSEKTLFVLNNLLFVKTDYEQRVDKKEAIEKYIHLVYDYLNGDIDKEAYSAAYSAADSAAYSAADSAAYSAAYHAACSAAYYAADYAAYYAADYAADSAAYSAADSAAYSAAE